MNQEPLLNMGNRIGKWEFLNVQIELSNNFTVGVGGVQCFSQSRVVARTSNFQI